jgi:hypothetical protein
MLNFWEKDEGVASKLLIIDEVMPQDSVRKTKGNVFLAKQKGVFQWSGR